MSISISGVALSIASGFLLLSLQSAASGGCGKRNEIYTYIANLYGLAMKTIQKINISLFIVLTLLFGSCDLSNDEYYIYSNNSENEIYFLWPEPSQCGVTINDTSINYDALRLYFPSDKSSINSHCETYYNPIRDTNGVNVDSVEMCDYCFKIAENDPRIIDNEYVIMYINYQNSIVRVDTMYRKKEKITFVDKLGLPKVH
jgi:hypothetical protein